MSDDQRADGEHAVSDSGSAVTGSAPRRPNPAASAASRARRIGGATGVRTPVDPVSSDQAGKTDSGKSDSGTSDSGTSDSGTSDSAKSDSRVSIRKRQPRTTSAHELKAEAGRATNTVTEVPAWLRWVPAAVLSVCALAMIIIIAVSAHGVWYAKPSATRQRDQVLAAAKRCMAVINTYNYKTLATDEKNGLACTTGEWTAQYKSALEKIVKPSATKLKAAQTVMVDAAGIETVTDNQWTTIVYGQTTINQSGATPQIDRFAAVVLLDKVGSKYLVSKVDLVTTPRS